MFEIVPELKGNCTEQTRYIWRPVSPGGHQILPRSSVSFSTDGNNHVYCFGGVIDIDEDDDNLEGQFSQELLAFNLKTQTWRFCEIKDKEAGGDAVPMAPAVPDTPSGSAFLAKPFFFHKQSRFAPTPRMHAGLCVLNETLYIFGGMFEVNDRTYTYNDFYALDLNKMNAWQVLIPNNENVHEWLESDNDDDEEKTTAANKIDEDEDEDDESSDDDDNDVGKTPSLVESLMDVD